MYVDSYLEIHTTLAAWKIYDLIYEILANTALTLLPFLGLIFSAIKEDLDDADAIGNAKVHVTRLIMAIGVYFFAMIPAWEVQPDNVLYQPPPTFADAAPAPVSGGDTTTTYDEAFDSGSYSAQAPLWWLFVHNVSAGITHAISDGLPKEPDIESLKETISYLSVQDPSTRAEYKSFTQQCFIPAKNKLKRWLESGNLPPQATAALARYGADDTNFPGSRTLQETPGLYADCNTSVGCLVLTAQHQTRDSISPVTTCGDWWPQLKDRLLAEDTSVLSWWQGVSAYWSLTNEETEDLRLRNIMSSVVVDDIGADNQYQDRGWLSDITGTAEDLFSIGPLAKDAFTKDTETRIVRKLLPFLKAFLMMFLTLFLPFMMLFTRYQFSAVIGLTVIFFGIHFIGAILNISTWLENVLIRSIMDDVDLTAYLANPIDVTQKRLILSQAVDIATYTSLLIWSGALSAAGFVGYKHIAGGGVGAAGAGSVASKPASSLTRNSEKYANQGAGKAAEYARDRAAK